MNLSRIDISPEKILKYRQERGLMLKRIREEMGLSGAQICKQCGIADDTRYRMENARSSWFIEQEILYLKALLEFKQNYAERFKQIRLKLGLSQEGLAKVTGIHRTTIQRIEDNKGATITVDIELIYMELWRMKKSAIIQ